ncbi:hypothetical protein [Afifella pfennigii]|uniref:hypothetical protein n=1 Tax=Afifella pfennigii TaxID=209897 RepID=UPI00047C2E17|nr:hypothetical protein [Afifella pfennigii]
MRSRLTAISLIACSLALVGAEARAQDENVDLAKQLANPVSSLISVPFQFNYDTGYGPADGDRAFVNIQPVIPFSLNESWNVISRTITPVILQDDIAGASGTQFGVGDVTQSLFFSPSAPLETGLGNITWGVGPVIGLPTGTDELLGTGKLSVGPTGVVLAQAGPWTYGALANHLWSLAGPNGRADVSATFLQPFISYTTPSAWTFSLNSESTYNWETEDWAIPVNLVVSKLTSIGAQKVQFQLGARYWVESPSSGPDGFGARAGAVFLFPR